MLSGGSYNPFVSLYVVEVTLAALLLPVRWVFGLGLSGLAGYALLLAWPHPPVVSGVQGSIAAMTLCLVGRQRLAWSLSA